MHLKTLAMLISFRQLLLKGDFKDPKNIILIKALYYTYGQSVPEVREEFIEHIKQYILDRNRLKEIAEAFALIHSQSKLTQEANIGIQFVNLFKNAKAVTVDEISAAEALFNSLIVELADEESGKLSQTFIAQYDASKEEKYQYTSEFTNELIDIIKKGVDHYLENKKQFGLRDSVATFFKGVQGGEMYTLFLQQLFQVPHYLYSHVNLAKTKLAQMAPCLTACSVILDRLKAIKIAIAAGSVRAQQREKPVNDVCDQAIEYIEKQKIILNFEVNILTYGQEVSLEIPLSMAEITEVTLTPNDVRSEKETIFEEMMRRHKERFAEAKEPPRKSVILGSIGGSVNPSVITVLPKDASNNNDFNTSKPIEEVIALKQSIPLPNIAQLALSQRASLRKITPEQATALKEGRNPEQLSTIDVESELAQKLARRQSLLLQENKAQNTISLEKTSIQAATMTLGGVIQLQQVDTPTQSQSTEEKPTQNSPTNNL